MSKEICKKLKEIRLNLAQKLGVKLNQEPCTYEGECNGTCPACEEEERVLNNALSNDTLGKENVPPINVDLNMSSTPKRLGGKILIPEDMVYGEINIPDWTKEGD